MNSNRLPHGPRPTTIPRSRSDAPSAAAPIAVSQVASFDSGLAEAPSAVPPACARAWARSCCGSGWLLNVGCGQLRPKRPALGGEVDAVVHAVSTAHSIHGMSRALRRHKHDLMVVAVEPAAKRPFATTGAVGPPILWYVLALREFQVGFQVGDNCGPAKDRLSY